MLASSGAQQESSAQRTSAPPSSGAPPERRSSGDFSSLTRFLEDRFSGRTSTHPEGRVVHSTVRERMLVWLLLAATVATALAGFLAF